MNNILPTPAETPVPETTAELAPLVARFYDEAPLPLRVRLLDDLLTAVGPLALVALAAGAFSSLLPHARWRGAEVTPGDALRINGDQVLELARYVEQKSPEMLLRLPEVLGDNPMWVTTISGAVLLIALRTLTRSRAG